MIIPCSTSSVGKKCAAKPRVPKAAQKINFQSHQTGVTLRPHCVMGSTVLLVDLDMVFLNSGIPEVLIPCLSRRRGKRQISSINAK